MKFSKGLTLTVVGILWTLATIWVASYVDSFIDATDWQAFPTFVTAMASGFAGIGTIIWGIVELEYGG